MQTALIISLVILVATLTALLYVRIRRERKERAALARIDLERFTELVRAPISDGSIDLVTQQLSQVLRESCGCRRIIFLQQRETRLQPVYYYGFDEVNPESLTIPVTGELIAALAGQTLPAPVLDLGDHLPGPLRNVLEKHNCDLCFPIFWQDRLYGLYFVTGSSVIRSPAFQIAAITMTQLLSAAYHLDWRHHQVGELQEQVDSLESDLRNGEAPTAPAGMFKLIRHRNSDTLVGRIINEVHRDLQLDRCAFLYPPKNNDEPIQIRWGGSGGAMETPQRAMFEQLMAWLDSENVEEVVAIGQADAALAPLAEGLQRAGLTYVAPFALSADRTGLLAWSDTRQPQEIFSGLQRHRLSVAELMANAESFEEVKGLSYTDGLTGLANQRYFVKRLEEEIGRATRYDRSLALIIFDLDELKSINDSYGHQAGDMVIQQMAAVLRSSVRAIDVVARYGGDEFCVIMPESDRATCTRFMRRLQQKIAGSAFKLTQLDREVTCTVSQGGAVFPDNAGDSDQLIYAADMALLKAKESGRDQFFLY